MSSISTSMWKRPFVIMSASLSLTKLQLGFSELPSERGLRLGLWSHLMTFNTDDFVPSSFSSTLYKRLNTHGLSLSNSGSHDYLSLFFWERTADKIIPSLFQLIPENRVLKSQSPREGRVYLWLGSVSKLRRTIPTNSFSPFIFYLSLLPLCVPITLYFLCIRQEFYYGAIFPIQFPLSALVPEFLTSLLSL